jgi:ring-1,2-phenylacetyl-CoA epoxidase subunit PaaD
MVVTEETIYAYLENVFDPEVPVLNILDLGIVRDVQVLADKIFIKITPTYSGCPAMQTIAINIKLELISRGITNLEIQEVLSPAWTTDWMTDEGKMKLKAYGIAPPLYSAEHNPFNEKKVPCPICDCKDTQLLSQFASTSCKAMYKCNGCLEAFDYFKCH